MGHTPPDQGRASGAGGHVIMLHADDNTYRFAVPPDDQYYKLLERTPGLEDIAASRRTRSSGAG